MDLGLSLCEYLSDRYRESLGLLDFVVSFSIMPIVSLYAYVTVPLVLAERDLIDSFIGITDKLNITVIAVIIIRTPPS